MTATSAATGLTVQQWEDTFFREYINANRFKPYMGTGENSIIQVKEDLTVKKGNSITIALLNKLAATNNSNTLLEGNEVDLSTRSCKVTVAERKNAVIVDYVQEQFSAISLRDAAKVALKDWALELDRDEIITALTKINGVAYGSASEANKDAWLVDNADRVLFGKLKSNNSSNDHSASLANIDATDDRLTPSALSLMKRMATTASPKIRPVRDEKNNQQFYVAFCDSNLFRDLKNNTTLVEAQRTVSLTEENSRLFRGGDLLWDNIIIHEVPDMPILSGVGALSINVGRCFLLGAQALGWVVAKRWKTETEVRDYGRLMGVATYGLYGVEKLTFGSGSGDTTDPKDHGVVTGYFASIADA